MEMKSFESRGLMFVRYPTSYCTPVDCAGQGDGLERVRDNPVVLRVHVAFVDPQAIPLQDRVLLVP